MEPPLRKNKVEGKSDTHAQEDHATSYLHLHLHYGKKKKKKKKWSLHYKKVEGKSDAHAQEEHATHRTVTILSHVIKWTRLIGHSRACVVNIFIFGGGNDSPHQNGVRDDPYLLLLCFPQRPTLFKNKYKKSRVGKAPNFAQIECFLRKMMEYAPKFGPFGCFLKNYLKKKIFRPTDPTFSKIPLEGNTTIIFLA